MRPLIMIGLVLAFCLCAAAGCMKDVPNTSDELIPRGRVPRMDTKKLEEMKKRATMPPR